MNQEQHFRPWGSPLPETLPLAEDMWRPPSARGESSEGAPSEHASSSSRYFVGSEADCRIFGCAEAKGMHAAKTAGEIWPLTVRPDILEHSQGQNPSNLFSNDCHSGPGVLYDGCNSPPTPSACPMQTGFQLLSARKRGTFEEYLLVISLTCYSYASACPDSV